MTDITFKVDNGYFIYKVGAIIIHECKVLMVKNENSPYYYTVGGRVGFGETSAEAVLREVYEETGIKLEIDRLACIHENYYASGFLGDLPHHEIGFYYLMKSSSQIENIECRSLGGDGGKETLHWLSIDELSNYTLFPTFYKTLLKDLPNAIFHFVTKE